MAVGGRRSLACPCATFIQVQFLLRWRILAYSSALAVATTGAYAALYLQALTEYWNNLPEEHKDTLFSMREEDFVAELDAHMKYQLKVPVQVFLIVKSHGHMFL